MADLLESQQSEVVRIGNPAEENFAEVTPDSNILTVDTPQQAVDGILSLNTTAVEGKIGATPLANRRYVEMEALTSKVKWGYSPACNFNLMKGSFYIIPCGEDCTIYFKADTGTAQVSLAEK
jgi:hypothetical protein